VLAVEVVKDDVEGFDDTTLAADLRNTSLSFCSTTAEYGDATLALKSKTLLEGFTAFGALLNDANAPVPRAKAEEALAVGDAITPVPRGEIALKGLGRGLCEESPPRRRAKEGCRGTCSCSVALDVDSDNLLELIE
jgi:hypothetical protein